MKINIDEIAKLARIKITPQERLSLIESMDNITKMLEKLDNLDENDSSISTDDNLSIQSSVDLEHILLKEVQAMQLRSDIIENSMTNEQLLKNAPKSMAGCIIVPKTIE